MAKGSSYTLSIYLAGSGWEGPSNLVCRFQIVKNPLQLLTDFLHWCFRSYRQNRLARILHDKNAGGITDYFATIDENGKTAPHFEKLAPCQSCRHKSSSSPLDGYTLPKVASV